MSDNVVYSYSQCQEDIYIFNLFEKHKKEHLLNGIYIELGALDGVLYSNTKMFQDHFGWKGILIEPHPTQFHSLVKNRPNNFLFNHLVSNSTDTLKYKFFENQHTAVSGIENTMPDNHFVEFFNEENSHLSQNVIYIKPRTLTDIVKSTKISHIDFMSLDVEGHEYEVLLSWDFSIPIDVILIEMLGGSQAREQLCRDILLNHGYKFHSIFKHNEVYVLDSFLQTRKD